MSAEDTQLDLEYLVTKARSTPYPLDEICMHVLNNPAFTMAPASKNHHHNYKGGLLAHTADIMRRLSNIVDSDVLVTATIWHDYHKIYEYSFHESIEPEPTFTIEYLPYSRLIGHVVGGYGEFVRVATAYQLKDSTIAKIGHCILSHHGRKEWGSPVEPQTDEAFLLHSMDMRSVQDTRS